MALVKLDFGAGRGWRAADRRSGAKPEPSREPADMNSMRKLLDLLGIDLPIVQAPTAGASSPELVAAASNAGGLGSYGCSRLSPAARHGCLIPSRHA
jgi:hypothetical protein